MKIHVLSEHIANGIAAGEVIERPVSVVKELVENALDADADRISVEIRNGGIKFLRVADNGSGMSPEDARLAFQRHATSKLQTLADLEILNSLGFRGEALASIAAVSYVRLVTRRPQDDAAFAMELEAGKVLSESEVAASVGSIFEVRNLFYNTPARYKFLKKDSTEAAYIQDLLERFAFNRPEISFSLNKDGKQSLITPGDGKLISVIYTIWGKESAEAALPLESEFKDVKVNGFISQSYHARKNRARQIFIANGRIIESPLLKVAVNKACQGYFVKGQFPEVLLKLELPPHALDVNVHPQKTEVRFADENLVFRAAYHSMRNALTQAIGSKEINLTGFQPESTTQAQKPVSPQFNQLSLKDWTEDSKESLLAGGDVAQHQPSALSTPSNGPRGITKIKSHGEAFSEKKLSEQGLAAAPQEVPKDSAVFHRSLEEPITNYDLEARLPRNVQAAVFYEANRQREEGQSIAANSSSYQDENEAVNPDLQELKNARLIGQIFDTYLLLEASDKLLIIDQHAAHERILYEKLREERAKSDNHSAAVQPLLQPLNLQFSPVEIARALDYQEEILKMGFEFEQFSENSLIVRAVPREFSDKSIDPARAFRLVIEEASEYGLDEAERLDEQLHTAACKAAVKAHDRLSFREMESLIAQLLPLKDPFHCPHGRPVIIRIKRGDLEKFFSRVV